MLADGVFLQYWQGKSLCFGEREAHLRGCVGGNYGVRLVLRWAPNSPLRGMAYSPIWVAGITTT